MIFYYEQTKNKPLGLQDSEIVERKGLGHPDTICDALADAMSVELNKRYIEEYGNILHYNLDKILLTAGESEPRFGGGLILSPIKIYLGDRATEGKDEQWVDRIIMEAGRNWFKKNMNLNDPDHDVLFYSEVKSGSKNLQDIFKRKTTKYLGANDTSATVGYYPLTPTEGLVKGLEQTLNSNAYFMPFAGEDIKVMAVRQDKTLHLTVSTAFVDRFVTDIEDYSNKKDLLANVIVWFCQEYFKDNNIDMTLGSLGLNALDNYSRGINGIFMTVNGTSAESGDSGQVGRGNDVMGLIPLCRPMASEAAPGKNPVSHVGKIYNALAFDLAKTIHTELDKKDSEVYCWLVSQIGKPINEPMHVAVKINGIKGVKKKDIESIIDRKINKLDVFCNKLANGEIKLW